MPIEKYDLTLGCAIHMLIESPRRFGLERLNQRTVQVLVSSERQFHRSCSQFQAGFGIGAVLVIAGLGIVPLISVGIIASELFVCLSLGIGCAGGGLMGGADMLSQYGKARAMHTLLETRLSHIDQLIAEVSTKLQIRRSTPLQNGLVQLERAQRLLQEKLESAQHILNERPWIAKNTPEQLERAHKRNQAALQLDREREDRQRDFQKNQLEIKRRNRQSYGRPY